MNKALLFFLIFAVIITMTCCNVSVVQSNVTAPVSSGTGQSEVDVSNTGPPSDKRANTETPLASSAVSPEPTKTAESIASPAPTPAPSPTKTVKPKSTATPSPSPSPSTSLVVKEATDRALKDLESGINAARARAGKDPVNATTDLTAESKKHALAMAYDQRVFRVSHPGADIEAVHRYVSTKTPYDIGYNLAKISGMATNTHLVHIGMGLAFSNGKAYVCVSGSYH
jgi:hypothetical protein